MLAYTSEKCLINYHIQDMKILTFDICSVLPTVRLIQQMRMGQFYLGEHASFSFLNCTNEMIIFLVMNTLLHTSQLYEILGN